MDSKWSNLRRGSMVTGFDTPTSCYFDNLIVTHLTHSYAVLLQVDTGKVVTTVLEPNDTYTLGEHFLDDNDCYVLQEYKIKGCKCTCSE